MVGTMNIGKRVVSQETSPQFDGYSKVIINISDTDYYEAGTDTGRTLELDNPWGTQEMANNILEQIIGFQYQPLSATGALLDPAAELGDGITVNGTYSGLFKQNINFGRLYTADIEAPQDEDINHEYPYQSKTDRKIQRQFANVESELSVQAQEISARVTKTGGDSKSFGWSLTEDGFVLFSNSKTVMTVDDTGAAITGTITATSGYIGNGSSGFTITDTAIRNGVLSMTDTSHYGVYIGTDGIVLGKGAFKVDSYGSLYATSGTFTGTVYAGSIKYGTADDGTIYGKLNGAGISNSTITTTQTDSTITNGVAGGNLARNVISESSDGKYKVTSYSVTASSLIVQGSQYTPGRISFYDGLGNLRTYDVLMKA